MSSHLALALLTGLSSLLVGLLVGRGLLKRRQAEKCRELAQDLTDKVHDRCDAYRRLEERISGVIGDFDRQEAGIHEEPVGQLSGPRAVPAPAAASADGLAWMDACAGSCQPASAQAEPTTRPASSVKSVENEIDVFATRLRGAQDFNRALLDEQSLAIGELQRRIASIESSARLAPSRSESARSAAPAAFTTAFGAGRRAASLDPELAALSERLARSEKELHEWRVRCEEVVEEREASIASAREVLERMRSDALTGLPNGAIDCEGCARAQDLARQILDIRGATAPEHEALRSQLRSVQPAPEARESAPASRREPQPFVSKPAGATSLREVDELQQRLAAKQQEVDSMRGELSRAGHVIEGNRTRITHLMRSLEQTQAKAEERRRLVQEQTSQVTEAYSMLDRMRPLLRAIEGAAAENQYSALTPEYLEARARG